MPGPLAGIRVVDVSQILSGPYACMILADQGAEVVKELGYDAGAIAALRAEGVIP